MTEEHKRSDHHVEPLGRVICDLPDAVCPHCTAEFEQASDRGYSEMRRGYSFLCSFCERTIWVEWVDVTVTVTLRTDDPDQKDG